MKILFDIGHPAHVHLFKNARQILLAQGNSVYCIARDKEITRQLLEAYKIDFLAGTTQRKGLKSIFELWPWFMKVRKYIDELAIDLVVSIGSPAGAWAAKLNGIPHLTFNDTETAPEQRLLYTPASTKIFTPSCLLIDFGAKHERYNGIHDLSYLRPEHFTPDPSVMQQLSLGEQEKFAIIRLVSWNATHDKVSGQKTSVSMFREIIELVSKKYRVFISAEDELSDEFESKRLALPPHRLHDALSFASVVISDGATMATEAAVLGRPTLYVSIARYINQLGVIKYLSKDFRLLDTMMTDDYSSQRIEQFLENLREDERKQERTRLLDTTINVAEFIAEKCVQYGKR